MLGDALGRIAIAAILFALDLVLKMIVQLLSVGEGVSRRLDDRRRQRVAKFRPRLAAMHRQSAKAQRLAVRVLARKFLSHRLPVFVRLSTAGGFKTRPYAY